MLRLDVDSLASGYTVPADNPTARLRAFGGGEPRPEAWAMGLRNPWRYSFDPLNGDLYIGEVPYVADRLQKFARV